MLRELRTFQAVVRHGSFSSAASNIGLTQSAVSAQIRRLEEGLGLVLFDRNGRTAVLNASGHEVLAIADELTAVYAKLGQNAATSRAGLIRVGAISSAQMTFLANALSSFRLVNPGCRVRVIPGVSLNLLGQVDSGEVEMAVIIKPRFTLPSDLQWRPLLSEPFALLAREEHAATAWQELLEREPFIRYDRSSFDGRLVEQFLRRMKIGVTEAIELDELQGIVQLVRNGAGVALIPNSCSLHLPPGVVAMELGDSTFFREVGLVERVGAGSQTAPDMLRTHIVEAAQAQMNEGLPAMAGERKTGT
jgi:DNA-binding transcriptional LysR family regulator